MLRIRGGEDDEWPVMAEPEHVGAEESGHLHVEKHERRPECFDGAHGRLPVGCLADDVDPVEGGEHAFEAGASDGLVVDHNTFVYGDGGSYDAIRAFGENTVGFEYTNNVVPFGNGFWADCGTNTAAVLTAG